MFKLLFGIFRLIFRVVIILSLKTWPFVNNWQCKNETSNALVCEIGIVSSGPSSLRHGLIGNPLSLSLNLKLLLNGIGRDSNYSGVGSPSLSQVGQK